MSDFKQRERVWTYLGYGTIVGEYNNDPNKVGFFQVQIEDGGAVMDFHYSRLSKESFFDYCFRPTGFGKTSWSAFTLLQMIAIGGIFGGISTWSDGGWSAVVMVAVIEAVLVFGTWMNFKGKWV